MSKTIANTFTTAQIAANYGMTARELNKLLNNLGIQYKVNGQWLLTKQYLYEGYTTEHILEINHTNEGPEKKLLTVWTLKGKEFIHEVMTEWQKEILKDEAVQD